MKVRITVMKKAHYADLQKEYELPQEMPCNMRTGQIFYTRGERPDGMCDSAWQTLLPFVEQLLAGGEKFYGEWMKDPKSAMLSCNDGFRPVSFLLEAIDG